MNICKSTNPDIIYKYERTVRVISHFKNNSFEVGTGFVINKGGNIVTCWHVVCGTDLKKLLSKPEFISISKDDITKKMSEYFSQISAGVQAEMPDGKLIDLKLSKYDHYYDIAIFDLPENMVGIPYFEIDHQSNLDYADDVLFCGYPVNIGYDVQSSPFTVNTGTVSTFPEVEVAGGKYENIQLNSICIGGNSGSPLFKRGSNIVSGIVNGFHWKGYDNLAIFENGVYKHSVSHKVPLNISFATSFSLLKQKTSIFQD